MVRTGDRCIRVTGGKSSEKKGGGSSSAPSSSAGPSTSKSNPAIGGNPVCPRETPSWQKPITCFFTREEASDRRFKKEIGESSKISATSNLEMVPTKKVQSVEEKQEEYEVIHDTDDEQDKYEKKDEVNEGNDEQNNVNVEEKEMTDEEKENNPEGTEAIAESKIEESKENKPIAEETGGSSDPITPTKKVKLNEADSKIDQKEESVLTTPTSEKKQSSSDDWSDMNDSGSDECSSQKELGGNSKGTLDENGRPVKKLKLDQALVQNPIDEAVSAGSINEHIKISSDENSDMDLDESVTFSPANAYQYMNGNHEEVINLDYDAPPQDDVPQDNNNPMENGYPGNNNNNDIPDDIGYPLQNGYPEDNGYPGDNNSDDSDPEDSDDDDTDDSDIDDEDDAEDEEDEEEDDDDEPFYANLLFYNNVED